MALDGRFLGEQLPLAIAHRGGGDPRWENTWPAFCGAVGLGYRVIETDVRVTADGHVVTFHDEDLKRVFDTAGKVSKLTFTELSRIRSNGSALIPRLIDVLMAWPQLKLNVDLKEPAVVEPFLEVLSKTRAYDRICVAGFSDRRTKHVQKRLDRNIVSSGGPLGVVSHLAAAVLPKSLGRDTRPTFEAIQVPKAILSWGGPARRLVWHSHAVGVQVHVWVVNDVQEMQRLLDLGIDGIITDAISDLRDLLIARGEWPQDTGGHHEQVKPACAGDGDL